VVRKISGREILTDLRSGMGDDDLARKYGLSASELKKVFKQVDRERAARAKAIAEDLKDGLSEAEVREKYNLTGGSFQKILETLLAEGLLTGTDLLARSAISQEVVVLDLRKGPRYQPSSSISVCEGGATQNRFALHDISEYGFAAKGIESRPGEILNIVVLGDEFGEVVPFEFQAECRWSKRGPAGNDIVSGFEIRAISTENQVLLRKFIAEYTGEPGNNNG
jgi:uncharacterized protein (DUF433 family)